MRHAVPDFVPGVDYMTDVTTYQQVQNGIGTGLSSCSMIRCPRYLHNGRGFAAYTHVDVLYQAYFTALLLMTSGRADEPWQSVLWQQDAERLRHLRRTGLCGVAG